MAPVIAGTFVRTEILKDRFLSVGDMHEVAKEFDLPFEAVQQAILFEDKRLAA
jgi:uncharacterized protein (DUF433 family)